MSTNEQMADSNIIVDDLTIDIFLYDNSNKSSLREINKGRTRYETTYKPGIIFLAPDISFSCWGIHSISSREQIRDIMTKNYVYLNNDGAPYPRKMAALRGFLTYEQPFFPIGVGIIMMVCGAGYDLEEDPHFGFDKVDPYARDGTVAPHHPKEGVEGKHITIWEKALNHLKTEGLITHPYRSKFVNGLEAFLIAGEYYNTGG